MSKQSIIQQPTQPLRAYEELAQTKEGKIYMKAHTNPDGTHPSYPFVPKPDQIYRFMFYFSKAWWYTARCSPEPESHADNPEKYYIAVPEELWPDKPEYRPGWKVEFSMGEDLKGEKLIGRIRQAEFDIRTKEVCYSVPDVNTKARGILSFSLTSRDIKRRVPKEGSDA